MRFPAGRKESPSLSHRITPGIRSVTKELRPHGFTLVEILIVVVVVAILASLILPQLAGMTENASETTAVYNVRTLRARIQIYESEHDGVPPTDLSFLTVKTNRRGNTDSSDGPLAYGPYLVKFPDNPLADERVASVVKPPSANPPLVEEAGAGWLYDAATGEVWINHRDYLDR
jgi:general secretion pathway protein G